MTTETRRFSKALALQVLDVKASRIANQEKFDRGHGTAQLYPRGTPDATVLLINRAVEYGRMRAFEQFAESVDEGFKHEWL